MHSPKCINDPTAFLYGTVPISFSSLSFLGHIFLNNFTPGSSGVLALRQSSMLNRFKIEFIFAVYVVACRPSYFSQSSSMKLACPRSLISYFHEINSTSLSSSSDLCKNMIISSILRLSILHHFLACKCNLMSSVFKNRVS